MSEPESGAVSDCLPRIHQLKCGAAANSCKCIVISACQLHETGDMMQADLEERAIEECSAVEKTLLVLIDRAAIMMTAADLAKKVTFPAETNTSMTHNCDKMPGFA